MNDRQHSVEGNSISFQGPHSELVTQGAVETKAQHDDFIGDGGNPYQFNTTKHRDEQPFAVKVFGGGKGLSMSSFKNSGCNDSTINGFLESK